MKKLLLLLFLIITVSFSAVQARDTDGDKLSDSFEIFLSLTDPKKADSDGNGVTDDLEDPDGDGLTNAREQDFMMDPHFPAVDAGGYLLEKEIREDAEDGQIDRWEKICGRNRRKVKRRKKKSNKDIVNVIDPSNSQNRVILFKKKKTFKLKADFPEYSQGKIEWDMKFNSPYIFIIICKTTQGTKFLYYTPAPKRRLFGWGPFIHHGLGRKSRRGIRMTVRRDLQKDIWDVFPEADLLSIKAFYVKAKGLIDNVITSAYADSDYDFIPDEIEDAAGLDKNDPSDAYGDIDGDGITNLEEFFAGTLVPKNSEPVANDQDITLDEDFTIALTLTASDENDDPLTFSVTSQPTNGSLLGIAPDLTYIPDSNFNGTDSFKFKVNDGSIDSNEATVNISVNPVNDAPTVSAGPDQTITLPVNSVNLNGKISDIDSTPDVTWSRISGPASVTFGDADTAATTASFAAQGIYVLKLTADDTDSLVDDTVTVIVKTIVDTDGDGLSDDVERAEGYSPYQFTEFIYVDALNGDDMNEGLNRRTAKLTITGGISKMEQMLGYAHMNEFVILLAPGTYTDSSVYSMYDLHLRSIDGKSAHDTIIDCSNIQNQWLYKNSGKLVLKGLTFSGATYSAFNVIYLDGVDDAAIRNCVFSDNASYSVLSLWNGSITTVSETVFKDNLSPVCIEAYALYNLRLVNSLFVGNLSYDLTYTDSIFYFEIFNTTFDATKYWSYLRDYSSNIIVKNSILMVDTYDLNYNELDASYNCSFDFLPGTGNINDDPRLDENGRLTHGSPCIDSASNEDAPDIDIDGQPRPQGAGYDMGADEYSEIDASTLK